MIRLVQLLSLGLVLSLVAENALARPGSDFLPMAVGDRRLYSVHWDRMVERPGEPLARGFSRGVSHEQVIAPGTRASAGAFQIQVDTIEWPAPGAEEKRERTQRFLEPTRNGVFLHVERNSAGAATGGARFHPPVQIVPASPVLGRKWNAGTLRREGVVVDLTGVVLRSEDVSIGANRYPNCLRLRLKGTPRGWAMIEGTRSEVTGGSVSLEVWLAPTLGVVKEITHTDLELTQGERTLETSTVVTRRLERAAGGEAPATP